MKRATDPRALLLPTGALVAIAGIVWGAGMLPHAPGKAPAATTPVAAPIASLPASAIPVAAPVVSAPHSAVPAPATVAGSAGMRIFKDPDSDTPGAPTAEASALEMDIHSEDDAGLVQVTLPDGSVMIDLQGRYQESMVVQIDAKGYRVVSCSHHPGKVHAMKPAASLKREEQ
jgi:hypothetical protein